MDPEGRDRLGHGEEAPQADRGRAEARGLIAVGRVVKPHGLDGEVAVETWTDFPERFVPGLSLALVQDESVVGSSTIESVRPHQGRLLVRFRGVEDADGAEALRGLVLSVTPDQTPARPEGYVFHHEVQGCELQDPRGRTLGVVRDLVEVGGRDLLVVTTPAGERDVPFTYPILVAIDLPGRRIVVDPPAGLLD